MEKREQLYEGKAKKVFATDDPNLVIVSYKDDATAFNGLKKGQIHGKGVVNNKMSNFFFKMLEEKGIKTHYVQEISDTEKVIFNYENNYSIIAGSLSKRLGIEEGVRLKRTVLEFSYKDDALGDPMVNDYHVLAIGIATEEELAQIKEMALKVNDILQEFLKTVNIDLVDFKLEFGRFNGEIILADEISPDTCRFWDSTTHEKLDKDRFRRDMGGVEDAYQEMMKRVGLK